MRKYKEIMKESYECVEITCDMCKAKYDDRIWSTFFDFVFPDDQQLTRKQVQTELRDSGIDMRPAITKLHGLLRKTRETKAGKAALEAAATARPSVKEKE